MYYAVKKVINSNPEALEKQYIEDYAALNSDTQSICPTMISYTKIIKSSRVARFRRSWKTQRLMLLSSLCRRVACLSRG